MYWLNRGLQAEETEIMEFRQSNRKTAVSQHGAKDDYTVKRTGSYFGGNNNKTITIKDR